MPQLDKVHFLSQYFWLCVFYFGFYFLVTKHFLPRMARILQFRKRKLSHIPEDGAHKELSLVKESGSTAVENAFSLSQKFWSHNSQRMDQWYKDNLYSLNTNYLQKCNKLYIKSLGDYSLSQNALLGGIELARPSPCSTWFFTHKLKQAVYPATASTAHNQGPEESNPGQSKPLARKGSQKARSANLGPVKDQSTLHRASAESSAKKGRQKKDNSTSNQPPATTREGETLNHGKRAKPSKA